MRVVVITRNERGLASRFLRRAMPEGIELVAVLYDTGAPTHRLRHYRAKARKLRRLGPSIAPVALVLRRLYARAEGEGAPSLTELPVRVERVASANSSAARALLQALEPDLLVTLGSRLLHERTFSIARLGTVNVHHGAVPRFRGGPPVFWELVEGEDEVGFIVHRIDAGVDTGPIYAAGTVPIERRGSLRETIAATVPVLYERSLDVLGDVLKQLATGTAKPVPQGLATSPPNTSPRWRDYRRAASR
jgi:methionyl-tRNA formyltransferase